MSGRQRCGEWGERSLGGDGTGLYSTVGWLLGTSRTCPSSLYTNIPDFLHRLKGGRHRPVPDHAHKTVHFTSIELAARVLFSGLAKLAKATQTIKAAFGRREQYQVYRLANLAQDAGGKKWLCNVWNINWILFALEETLLPQELGILHGLTTLS